MDCSSLILLSRLHRTAGASPWAAALPRALIAVAPVGIYPVSTAHSSTALDITLLPRSRHKAPQRLWPHGHKRWRRAFAADACNATPIQHEKNKSRDEIWS